MSPNKQTAATGEASQRPAPPGDAVRAFQGLGWRPESAAIVPGYPGDNLAFSNDALSAWTPGHCQFSDCGRASPATRWEPSADEDVFASRSVTYEDPVATEEVENRAANNAEDSYRQSPQVTERVQEDVKNFFDEASQIRDSEKDPDGKVEELLDVAPFYLPENTARKLVFLEDSEVEDVERYVGENLQSLYDSAPVADNDIQNIPASVVKLSEGAESSLGCRRKGRFG